ncbi:MAG: discoidin domain-containing protein [Prevotella sp.]|nr:discoidin domain-containing protein [Prevotella sp.]
MNILRTILMAVVAFATTTGRATDTTRPWTFWYWMYGAVSQEGIKADLQAMKNVGLGGCYLMPIRGVSEKPEFEGQAQQLSPAFWQMVDYAFSQADSLGLEMGLHVCDGFALAGGPWISSEESMQQVVSTITSARGQMKGISLERPTVRENYYEDIATFAFPLPEPDTFSFASAASSPQLSMSATMTLNDRGIFAATEPAWVQYDFLQPHTFRHIVIAPNGTNMQAQRMCVEVSDDGINFRTVKQLVPPRQGWQNYDQPTTFAFPPATARYWRLSWTPEGSEPGSEDMDAAKWRPRLGLKDAVLGSSPRIESWEGKAGLAWRIATATTASELPDADCVQMADVVRLELDGDRIATDFFANRPYCIVRIGHTSTGYTNATAGGGRGLECDKFSAAAVNKQLDNWFERFMQRPHASVVKFLHVDSWECGCQNWSSNFASEFQRRRGYDLMPYLPLLAGIPMVSAQKSEEVLRDVRLTVNDLIHDVFFAAVGERAHRHGLLFSAESVAPTMVADGMEHYRLADMPMGEYWLNSPTHDKPNDMLDAISGAHLYGKPIIQAEGFTEVRGVWDETPAGIKPLLDRNLALGMNRLFFHVFTHNPWTDRRPGMTLDGIGLFFQRDQTWFPEARGLVDYVTRCQRLLQQGEPVTDIAVYTGDEMPRRAWRPEQLADVLPGLMGSDRVEAELQRRANVGQPMTESPVGVKHQAGITDPAFWVNPLGGYAYDSMNPDALFHQPFNYRVLVVPQGVLVSDEARQRIDTLRQAGVTIIDRPFTDRTIGGLLPDVQLPEGIAFCHRWQDSRDIYFLSNQQDSEQRFIATFRCAPRHVVFFDPLANRYFIDVDDIIAADTLTVVRMRMKPRQSLFVLFGFDDVTPQVSARLHAAIPGPDMPQPVFEWRLKGKWQLTFRESGVSMKSDTLFSWASHSDPAIRFFSGHARYKTTIRFKERNNMGRTILSLGQVHDVAHVWLNGRDIGIVWMPPYEVDVTGYMQQGDNTLEVEVVNTWHNALRGTDQGTPPYDGIWTNARYRTPGDSLLPAGLLGPVELRNENY